MDHICTWFCADEKGQESIFPQTGKQSSSPAHQLIYWRCLILFFASSRRFNKLQRHILFTNATEIPMIGAQDAGQMLSDLEVEIVYTDFNFKTPKGYFGMFQNQFYEFSILEHIVKNNPDPGDNYMILDSDCLFLDTAAPIFSAIKNTGFMSFEDDCKPDLNIHGLSRIQMKALYEDLLNQPVMEIPGYHLGEFFMASVKNIGIIFNDFVELWPEMIRRFSEGLPKFNEEAQTLSYIYYKNGFKANPARNILKRIWTNPVFYRNVEATDDQLTIWHLPSEKTFGLADLYEELIVRMEEYGFRLSNEAFLKIVRTKLGIPVLTPAMRAKYYALSYWRALAKRAKKLKPFKHIPSNNY